jgi:hypothetical protein
MQHSSATLFNMSEIKDLFSDELRQPDALGLPWNQSVMKEANIGGKAILLLIADQSVPEFFLVHSLATGRPGYVPVPWTLPVIVAPNAVDASETVGVRAISDLSTNRIIFPVGRGPGMRQRMRDAS